MKGCSLAAGKGGLDRVVRFVDCMEIPDMKAWMRPNVFYITTGYTYSNSEEEIIQLIRDLYDAKAAALATKYKYIGCSLEAAIKVADELQFPLILWPEDLPFIEMNYLVMEALIKSQNSLMDSMQSRIKRYNQREMDQRLFVDLLTGNIATTKKKITGSRNRGGPCRLIRLFISKLIGSSRSCMSFGRRKPRSGLKG